MLIAGFTSLFVLVSGPAAAVPPSNDDFPNRETVASVPFTDTENTTEATNEPSEQQPSCGFNMGGTVWYQYTPGSGTVLRADSIGSDFDTLVAVWTGSALGSLTEIACDDESGPGSQSDLGFQATGGTTYLFQVGGYNGDAGNLTFHLSTIGAIAGTVTAEGAGTPLEDIGVDVVFPFTGDPVQFTRTNASGQYMAFVVPGTYQVRFGGSEDRAAEYYNNKLTLGTADTIEVVAGTVTTGINAELGAAGFISGTVTAEGSGSPLESICVFVADPSIGNTEGFARTDSSGEYIVGGLASTSYKVSFSDGCDGTIDHVEEYYNNKPDFSTADPVSVTQGATTSGINAALTPIGSGPPPAPPPPSEQPQAKSASLSAKPKKVQAGERTRLKTLISPCTEKTQGDVVEFYRGTKKIASKVADAACSATARVKIRKTARYRSVSPADANSLAATSQVVKVKAID
jgi:hypothetical protein